MYNFNMFSYVSMIKITIINYFHYHVLNVMSLNDLYHDEKPNLMISE